MQAIANSHLSFEKVVSQFSALGVTDLFAKWLAPNDNSKNQIYLSRGRGAEELFNLFPTNNIRRERTSERNDTIKASVDFGWLDEEGGVTPAPNAQLILYPQYPEVRFSGFLAGADRHPGELVSMRLPGRLLLLGVTRGHLLVGSVFAFESETALELRKRQLIGNGVLNRIPLADDRRKQLIEALGGVHRRGWIRSRRLKSDHTFAPCGAPNCGGLTLEAELGIPANSSKNPDYWGWELKAHSSTSLTLMTPEPTGGLYREMPVRSFLGRFGRSNSGSGRLDFTGPFRVGKLSKELTLTLDGFDAKKQTFDPAGRLLLLSTANEIAAEWSFENLLAHWSVKHARVAYVRYRHRVDPANEYLYESTVRLGEGTRFGLLLHAISLGHVKYDPGIHLDVGKTVPKRRSQFRVNGSQLSTLYDAFDVLDVTACGDPVTIAES